MKLKTLRKMARNEAKILRKNTSKKQRKKLKKAFKNNEISVYNYAHCIYGTLFHKLGGYSNPVTVVDDKKEEFGIHGSWQSISTPHDEIPKASFDSLRDSFSPLERYVTYDRDNIKEIINIICK